MKSLVRPLSLLFCVLFPAFPLANDGEIRRMKRSISPSLKCEATTTLPAYACDTPIP
jgi:hypothetical protein